MYTSYTYTLQYLIRGLIMHDQFIVHEIEAVRPGLIRVIKHIRYYIHG